MFFSGKTFWAFVLGRFCEISPAPIASVECDLFFATSPLAFRDHVPSTDLALALFQRRPRSSTHRAVPPSCGISGFRSTLTHYFDFLLVLLVVFFFLPYLACHSGLPNGGAFLPPNDDDDFLAVLFFLAATMSSYFFGFLRRCPETLTFLPEESVRVCPLTR